MRVLFELLPRSLPQLYDAAEQAPMTEEPPYSLSFRPIMTIQQLFIFLRIFNHNWG